MSARISRSVLREGFVLVWRADRRGTLVAALLQLLAAVAGLGVVVSSRFAFEALLAGDGALRFGLVAPLVALAVATALVGAAGVLQQQQDRLLGERVAQHMWRRLLAVTGSAGLMAWEDPDWIERLDRVRMNALQRPVVIVSSILSIVGGALSVVLMGSVLVSIHPALLPAFLVTGVPAVLVGRAATRSEFGFAVGATPIERRRTYAKRVLTERRSAPEVLALDAPRYLGERHEQWNAQYLALLRRQVHRRQRLGLVTAAASAAGLSLTLLVIILLVDRGDVSLAEAGAAAIGARLLGGQLSGVFRAAGALSESVPFLRDMRSFFDDHAAPARLGERRTLRRELTLDAVSFGYPGSSKRAVDGATVRVRAGQLTALVGENGSGKTTLAKIAAGLYPPDEGGVLWDGEGERSMADISASVSVLFQDFNRYQMTAAENIAIADGSRVDDHAAVRAAAERVGLDQKLASLVDGYDTELGVELSGGTDLSGGQWQRLALARALYRDASVIILDEPSAALDPRAEFELFADLRQVIDGRAALLITHRYSTARLADEIYVMHEGRVVESGSHEDLMARRGRYAELYELQASSFSPDEPLS